MAERGRAGSLDVTEGVIWRQLLLLCVPVFFSSFFQEAYSLVNTFVVGQYAGKAALGGIQATAPLVDLAVGFSVGMGTGFAVVCSQYFGARDEERLSASVHTAMTIALVGGLAVSVLGSLLAEPILSLMGTPADLMAESLAFVRIYFGAMVFSIVYNTGSAVQRSVGDTRSPSIIVASTCVVNIVLDLVLVAGMHMEAAGAGLATALSLVWGCALTLARLTHVDGPWRLDLRRLRIDRHLPRHAALRASAGPAVVLLLGLQHHHAGHHQLLRLHGGDGLWPVRAHRRHHLDGLRGPGRGRDHVLGPELRRAQLRAHAPGP